MPTKGSLIKAHRPGKKPKNFLDTNGAVELANSIAGLQESKTFSKVNKRRDRQELPLAETKTKPKQMSAAKIRLKETKARISAERAILKKAKRLLKDTAEEVSDATPSTPSVIGETASGQKSSLRPHESRPKAQKKRVSFA